MDLDTAKEALRRRAIRFEIGGFRPPEDPHASWFGCVNFAGKGEEWPTTSGDPMHALCQINITELPFRPPRLEDIDFITVFVGPTELPNDDSNGNNWCLRAYQSLEELKPLPTVETPSPISPFPMRAEVVHQDYPIWDDVDAELDEEIENSYYDHFQNVTGFKFGGWPTLIQSEIFWAPWNKHPASPEYVFQIDTTEKGNWMWGDNGVGYFGRGTSPGNEDEWTCEWQCY